MLDLSIISPVMIKLFIECKKKFYYRYIEQIPNPKLDKTFITGKNIHALASYFLKGINIENIETNLSEKENDYWNYLKTVPYFDYEVIGVEKNITTKIDNFWIGGRIDAIVKNNNHIYILDYKTGGVNTNMVYDPQTMVYMILCDKYFEQFKNISFVYIDLKNKKEVKIDFSDSLKNEYISKLVEICSNMINFNYNKFTRNENCTCEYDRICR